MIDSLFRILTGDCSVCGDPIGSEASVVGKKHFHPHCFVCEKCGEPLGTTQYFIIGGKNYCERDSKVSELVFRPFARDDGILRGSGPGIALHRVRSQVRPPRLGPQRVLDAPFQLYLFLQRVLEVRI